MKFLNQLLFIALVLTGCEFKSEKGHACEIETTEEYNKAEIIKLPESDYVRPKGNAEFYL